MKPNRSLLSLLAVIIPVVLSLAVRVAAQEAGQPSEGKVWGNYSVRQSIEFGWRGTKFTGNQQVFDTFVNLRQGARLYGQTLEMRSLDHKGLLFDDFFMTNFGYGGDPNDFSLVRASKNKWYNFGGSFRRDRNLWNYNLLANPLNPTNSNPTLIIGFSPHLMRLSRRMSDFNLTLLPQSRVRFRLGYGRNINEGPSFTTFHEGTDVLLFQDWKTTLNSYQAGIDFKLLPRTNISYDQFLYYYKGDTSWVDQNFTFRLADGTPVDLGLPFNTRANQPCAVPIANSSTTPPTVTPSCNGYLAYQQSGWVRTSYPTEQLSFQSSYFKNLDLAGRVVYSSSVSNVPNFQEFFRGLVTRTNQRQFAISELSSVHRISVSADAAATWTVTTKFRIADEFRFWNWRIPGQANNVTNSLFGTSLLLPPSSTHNANSPADNASAVSSLFLGQDLKLNSFHLEYDFTKRFGGRLGHRYRHRVITHRDVELATGLFLPTMPQRGACAGKPLQPDGSCTASTTTSDADETTINEHSLLLGLWIRPLDSLRVSYDQELMSADNAFTRISPRQLQHYKLRATYKPAPWMSFAGTVNVYEARNNVAQINHLEHSRNYGFSASIAPEDRWSVDLGYNYTGIFSQTNICFIFGFGPPPPGFGPCPVIGSPVPLQGISIYNNKLNYGYADVMLKPIKRVTLKMGYGIDSVTGNTLILNPNSPPGPLNFNYHRPYGSVAIDLGRGWSGKAGWGFYDYNEKGTAIDPIGQRSFRGNLVNLSAVYSF